MEEEVIILIHSYRVLRLRRIFELEFEETRNGNEGVVQLRRREGEKKKNFERKKRGSGCNVTGLGPIRVQTLKKSRRWKVEGALQ